MLDLRIVGSLHLTSSYASVTRTLVAAAQRAGINVQAVDPAMQDLPFRAGGAEWRHNTMPSRPLREPTAEIIRAVRAAVPDTAPTMIVGPAHAFLKYGRFCTPKGPRIGNTTWESSWFPRPWKPYLDLVDYLCVQSSFNRAGLDRSIIARVLWDGVDERVWTPAGPKMELAAIPDRRTPPVIFGSVFCCWDRKNWKQMLSAFYQAFPDGQAGLVIKTDVPREVEVLASQIRDAGAWVQVVTGYWQDATVASFYRAIDCYVLPSAEGFGLPYAEAALCGIPSIALDDTGSADVVTPETGYPVRSYREPCYGHMVDIYTPENTFAKPDLADLTETFRRAAGDADRKSRGERARGYCLESFGLDATAERLKALLESVRNVRNVQRPVVPELHNTPGLSVIITTHNHLEHTRRCVASLREHTPAARIILADDNSTDGTREWAAAEGLLLIAGPTPGNLSASRNAGREHVRQGDYVAYFDNDIEVLPEWWERLAAVFSAYPEIGILAPAKILPGGKLQNVGSLLFPDGHTDEIAYERDLIPCDFVETACLVARPEVHEHVRFDEAFPIWYEDADYCRQAKELGWQVAATALARVTHDAHTSSRERLPEMLARREQYRLKWQS